MKKYNQFYTYLQPTPVERSPLRSFKTKLISCFSLVNDEVSGNAWSPNSEKGSAVA